jgi:hypothetical protein
VEEFEAVVVCSELNALVSAMKDVSGVELVVRMLSPSSGVVTVGEEDADVVIATVVMPIRLVVTTVSMRGDCAVSGMCVGVSSGSDVGVDAPPVDSFFSMFVECSAGAGDEPPRHGKQQRNSVDRSDSQCHDNSSLARRPASCFSGARRYD